jgi:hypothetical protein
MSVDDISDIKIPGTLFGWDHYVFVSDGISGGELNVRCLGDYGSSRQYDLDVVEKAIDNEEIQLLKNHIDDYTAVPERQLTILLKFVADDSAFDGIDPVDNDIAHALHTLERKLPAGAYNFRFRDE